MRDNQARGQLLWGVLLCLAGAGVFVYVMPLRLPALFAQQQIEASSFQGLFTYFCLGVIGILLIGGGVRKIYRHLKQS
jgi:hypothetical protein